MFKAPGDRGGTGIDRFFAKIVGSWANLAYRQANTAYNQANTAFNNANATLVVTATTPTPVRANSLYWNSELGRLYIQYQDTDTAQFVEVTTNPLVLRDTGATAGTYGGIDSSNTLSLTVDSKGRITAIANNPATLIRFITSEVAGVNTAAQSQNWFPTTGNVTVAAGTTYLLDGLLSIVDTATTHTQSLLFGGTATFDWFEIDILHTDGANNATQISSSAASAIGRMRWEGTDAATARVLNATSTVGQHWTKVNGLIVVKASGTITPRFQVSAVGAAVTGYTAGVRIRPGTYFSLFPIGANTATAIGPWSA